MIRDTSRLAAASIRGKAPTVQQQVLEYLVRSGTDGCTDEETAQALGLRTASQTARRNELCESGLVVDSGRRRLTSAGRSAIVWVATPTAAVARPGCDPRPPEPRQAEPTGCGPPVEQPVLFDVPTRQPEGRPHYEQ